MRDAVTLLIAGDVAVITGATAVLITLAWPDLRTLYHRATERVTHG